MRKVPHPVIFDFVSPASAAVVCVLSRSVKKFSIGDDCLKKEVVLVNP